MGVTQAEEPRAWAAFSADLVTEAGKWDRGQLESPPAALGVPCQSSCGQGHFSCCNLVCQETDIMRAKVKSEVGTEEGPRALAR